MESKLVSSIEQKTLRGRAESAEIDAALRAARAIGPISDPLQHSTQSQTLQGQRKTEWGLQFQPVRLEENPGKAGLAWKRQRQKSDTN